MARDSAESRQVVSAGGLASQQGERQHVDGRGGTRRQVAKHITLPTEETRTKRDSHQRALPCSHRKGGPVAAWPRGAVRHGVASFFVDGRLLGIQQHQGRNQHPVAHLCSPDGKHGEAKGAYRLQNLPLYSSPFNTIQKSERGREIPSPASSTREHLLRGHVPGGWCRVRPPAFPPTKARRRVGTARCRPAGRGHEGLRMAAAPFTAICARLDNPAAGCLLSIQTL